MNTKKLYWIFFILIAMLTGCQTTQEVEQQSLQLQTVPLGFAYNDVGDLVHIHSGSVFPIYLEKFKRGEVTTFDDEIKNISVLYTLNRPPAVATVYIYPTINEEGFEIALEDEIKNVNFDIATWHPDGIHIGDVPTTISLTRDPNKTVTGFFSSWFFIGNFGGKQKALTSYAYLYMKDGWFIKFRITSPKGRSFKFAYNMVHFLTFRKLHS